MHVSARLRKVLWSGVPGKSLVTWVAIGVLPYRGYRTSGTRSQRYLKWGMPRQLISCIQKIYTYTYGSWSRSGSWPRSWSWSGFWSCSWSVLCILSFSSHAKRVSCARSCMLKSQLTTPPIIRLTVAIYSSTSRLVRRLPFHAIPALTRYCFSHAHPP